MKWPWRRRQEPLDQCGPATRYPSQAGAFGDVSQTPPPLDDSTVIQPITTLGEKRRGGR